MPGPPIRKPSDHSPPAGSPRNIAGHHVLHRPLMPRHPPNAQKNKQQRHTNKTRNTLSQKSYSKMLASTIQFTTNPPTPTHNPQQQTRSPRQVRQPGRTAPEPRQHATPTHAGAPTTPHSPHKQEAEARQACFLHQSPDKPTTPHTSARQSTAQPSAGQAPSRPRPNKRPRQHTTRKPPPHKSNP